MARRSWLRAGEAADYIHVSYHTLRSYVRQGRITPERTPAGQAVYPIAELDRFLGRPTGDDAGDSFVFYVRVSSGSASTKGQEERLRARYGEPGRVYRDRASGLNESRRGLAMLKRDARKGLFSVVCVTARDRLTRFGYSYLEELLGEYGVRVLVMDDEREPDAHEELMRDFLSLLASFSSKYYKLRSLKHERMMLEQAGRELGDNDGAGVPGGEEA